MSTHVCPFFLGYLLACPIRRLIHDPRKILGPLVKAGMTVLDIGPAMGFFTLPLARMVGPSGKVVCVDVQERMLGALVKRAQAAGLADRIATRVCPPTSLGIDDHAGKIDFALAFAVVHEVPDAARLFADVARGLRPGAQWLVAEPTGHVTVDAFERTIAVAREAGLVVIGRPRIALSHAALFGKPAGANPGA